MKKEPQKKDAKPSDLPTENIDGWVPDVSCLDDEAETGSQTLHQSRGRLSKAEKQALNRELQNFTETVRYAKHDPIHCLAPGLFRSLDKKTQGKPHGFDFRYEYGEITVNFRGPYLLGVFDLKLLQSIVAMAGVTGNMLTAETKAPKWVGLREKLALKWAAQGEHSVVAITSWREIAKIIGIAWSGKDCVDRLRRSLDHLWAVTVVAEKQGRRQGFQMLSYMEDDQEYLCVAVNPQITAAVLGDDKFVRIRLDEVKSLKADGAVLIHQRLCAWINPGQTRKAELETLIGYVWPDAPHGADQKKVDQVIRRRRSDAKKLVFELEEAGWNIREYDTNKFEITRPAPEPSLFQEPGIGLFDLDARQD